MALIVTTKTAEGDRWFMVDSDGNVRSQEEKKRDFKDFIFHPFSGLRHNNRCGTLKGFAVKTKDGGMTELSVRQVFQHANERDYLKRLSGAMPVGYHGSSPKGRPLGQVGYAYFE